MSIVFYLLGDGVKVSIGVKPPFALLVNIPVKLAVNIICSASSSVMKSGISDRKKIKSKASVVLIMANNYQMALRYQIFCGVLSLRQQSSFSACQTDTNLKAGLMLIMGSLPTTNHLSI